jgi:hypothetical protein
MPHTPGVSITTAGVLVAAVTLSLLVDTRLELDAANGALDATTERLRTTTQDLGACRDGLAAKLLAVRRVALLEAIRSSKDAADVLGTLADLHSSQLLLSVGRGDDSSASHSTGYATGSSVAIAVMSVAAVAAVVAWAVVGMARRVPRTIARVQLFGWACTLSKAEHAATSSSGAAAAVLSDPQAQRIRALEQSLERKDKTIVRVRARAGSSIMVSHTAVAADQALVQMPTAASTAAAAPPAAATTTMGTPTRARQQVSRGPSLATSVDRSPQRRKEMSARVLEMRAQLKAARRQQQQPHIVKLQPEPEPEPEPQPQPEPAHEPEPEPEPEKQKKKKAKAWADEAAGAGGNGTNHEVKKARHAPQTTAKPAYAAAPTAAVEITEEKEETPAAEPAAPSGADTVSHVAGYYHAGYGIWALRPGAVVLVPSAPSVSHPAVPELPLRDGRGGRGGPKAIEAAASANEYVAIETQQRSSS